MVIRPFHPSDIPDLYSICLKTGDNGNDASHLFENPNLIGDFYAVPYVIYEPELCFVLVKDGRPVGYVLGTSDTTAFEQWIFDEWFPPLREKYPKPDDATQFDMRTNILKSIHKTEPNPSDVPGYPAHLHIDILPEGQGGGWGLKLMEAFWEKLRSMGVPAVHLGVSKANENAVGFYKHIGYHVISEHDWGYMLGKKLEPGKDATKRLQDRVAFEKLAKTHNLNASASSIFAISEPCLHLASTISRDEDIPVGASKFGGDPDVPPGFEWPYWQNSFLSLLLQVNLSELQALFPTTDLPKTGLLSIFFEHNNDAVFINPDDQESFQVYYFDKTDSLRRTNSPETPKFQFSYPPCKVEFKISRSFPSPISKVLHNVGMSDWEIDSSYSDLYYGHLELSNPKHQIFGHPFIHQDDDFGIKSQLLSNRISLKNNFVFTDESMSNKRKGAEDWILFFQIDTDTNTQMHWGISEGTLYFVIRKEQLEMHNFTEICLLRQYI